MAKRRLRSGFTTGACAAAAAKAACLLLFAGKTEDQVSIPFPDGSHKDFAIKQTGVGNDDIPNAWASVIKDAGDDPDVTNGAEIVARVSHQKDDSPICIKFAAGTGVGTVTKPGLAVEVGEPAINPVPRQMISEAVHEALDIHAIKQGSITVTISIPKGEELATKTLNHRLGIVGGLSILGTTGIVRPISADAWTATIKASMAVAEKTGCSEIALSTGRTSEKAVQDFLGLPIEAYAMMGDYLQFSLLAARDNNFKKIHLAAMWAKVLKAAMQIPQTHVRHGALEAKEAAIFIGKLGNDATLEGKLSDANTAREIFDRLNSMNRPDIIRKVCRAAKQYAEETSTLPVDVYLVVSPGKVVEHV